MICDAHVHVGYFERLNYEYPFYYSPRRISSILKRCGVNSFIFSSISSYLKIVNQKSIIDETVELKKEFGHGAYAFYWLSGEIFDNDRDLTCVDTEIFDGVKLHELETNWSKRPKDLDYILSILEERKIPVQFHIGEDFGCYPNDYLPFVQKHSFFSLSHT